MRRFHHAAKFSRARLLAASSPRPQKSARVGMLMGAVVFPVVAWVALKDDPGVRRYFGLDDEAESSAEVDVEQHGMVPASRLGGPFTMLDSSTGKLTNDRAVLRGRWTLLYFGFTHCAEVCPRNMRFMNDVLRECATKECAADADPVELRICFASVDAIRDSATKMQQFLAQFPLPNAVAHPLTKMAPHCGLVGDEAQIASITRAWRVFFSSFAETPTEAEERAEKGYASLRDAIKDDDSYQFDHSAAVYFVGPDGQLRDLFFESMGVSHAVERISTHLADGYGVNS